MALIKCPECGKEVSDKAQSCIHCGYPFLNNDTLDSKLYKVILTKINQNQKIKTVTKVREFTGLGLADAKKFVETLPNTIISGISMEECKMVQSHFSSCDANVDIQIDNTTKERNTVLENINIPDVKDKNNLTCPKCGSTSVVIGQRGFSLLTGFIGSNKTVNRCGNCGYRWKP